MFFFVFVCVRPICRICSLHCILRVVYVCSVESDLSCCKHSSSFVLWIAQTFIRRPSDSVRGVCAHRHRPLSLCARGLVSSHAGVKVRVGRTACSTDPDPRVRRGEIAGRKKKRHRRERDTTQHSCMACRKQNVALVLPQLSSQRRRRRRFCTLFFACVGLLFYCNGDAVAPSGKLPPPSATVSSLRCCMLFFPSFPSLSLG